MSSFVVDASAMGALPPQGGESGELFAPEIIDLEVANLLRKSVLRRQRDAASATSLLAEWMSNRIVRCSHASLISRVWQLRDNVTPYDAAYVALAELLGIPLVTADRRLASAATRHCEVITVSTRPA